MILAAKGGTNVGKKWPMNFAWNARLPRNIQGSFTCRKSTTWDQWLYFPSEGSRAEDFFALKNPGLNPQTWVLKASTQPLDHRSRSTYKPSLCTLHPRVCNITMIYLLSVQIYHIF
jgi:hypothetical protein